MDPGSRCRESNDLLLVRRSVRKGRLNRLKPGILLYQPFIPGIPGMIQTI